METLAPRNARNEGAYDLIKDVAPAEEGISSAYARPKNAEGNAVGHPLAAVAHAYDRLIREQIDNSPPNHEQVTVPLWYVSIENGVAVKKKRGLYSGIRQTVPVKTGRFHAKLEVAGGSLLDRLFRGERVDVLDARIWDALFDLVSEHADSLRDGGALRQLNDSVALLVLLRSGVVGNIGSLGRVGGSHDRHAT